MNYSLRNSKIKDKAWIESLRREVYRELFDLTWGGWDEERHQRHFATFLAGGHIQIIEVSNSPVGILQIFESEDKIVISEVQISLAYQGKGLGSKILNDIINRAKEVAKNVTLKTGLKNQGAIDLYNELGFQETNRSETHVHMMYVTK